MKWQTFILGSALLTNVLAWGVVIFLLIALTKPTVRSIMRDLAPPRAARCFADKSHETRPACMVGLRAVALNGRRIAGVICHGDLGAPAVRMLG